MRIDKYLANMNVGSRKEVHQLIKKGIVAVNGTTVKTPKQQVKESDQVTVNGDAVAYQKYHYFLLNKPKGVLSATEDRSQPTVISILAPQDRYQGIVPVGRLDKDTTGLLLLTNDGQLNHELLAPGKHVDKVYRAEIAGVANDTTVKTFASGMTLGDGTKLQPAELKILSQDEEHDRSTTEIKIREGKYHQIKRMFGAVGMKVVELERISMGKLTLPANLKRGEYLELKLEDIVG
ncbi:pseudouridine synthase [Lactobacillus crispatus]|uniref:Pseudouridine synthase n=1 Tax=Lactobacillus crispatus TaxID=47770 RepID=A0AB73BSE2_9LACO|nr:pseudouridine synthase [Lactobacillus crispatus]KAA8794589.1 rRNA pseudouridine synthase [Lactobacillus crispatus]KAA8799215.1 rRNA pseudouridine synthase [Lactobacillus crispatus]KAA8799484.1 rRNA pseudouridine synthase [Lactobacillus crispatus]KAA8802319.1 rRNA pseudouridine synthase [Lactobacillus crispatus]KAA8802511.1 rRNA pseudouridine synthase [Lactobacillus crispatus]